MLMFKKQGTFCESLAQTGSQGRNPLIIIYFPKNKLRENVFTMFLFFEEIMNLKSRSLICSN